MSVEKLSISLDSDLAAAVREAARAEGLTVSTWLAEAARAKARLRALRDALRAADQAFGALGEGEIEAAIAAARRKSVVTGRRRRAS